MRIALHADGRTLRGNEHQLVLLVRGLTARGHEVHAACVPRTPVATALQQAGAQVSGARPRGDADLLNATRFVRWLRAVRPDAVLLTSWKRAALSAALARLARVPRIIIRIGGEHGSRGRAGDVLRRHALEHWVHDVWVNCDAVRDNLLRYAPGLPHARVHVIPSAVPHFDGPPSDLRQELGLETHTPLLLSAGGLEHRKGYDVLLAALAALPDPRVHLAIAGAGPERDALEQQAVTLGIASRVHLLGQRADVRALLPSATTFVLPSRSDSVPIAVLEAADAGLPIISSAVPGVPELLAPRTDAPAAGWVVPVGNAGALAAALEAALEVEAGTFTGGAAEARRRGEEARRRVAQEHSPERLVTDVETLLAPAAGTPSYPPR